MPPNKELSDAVAEFVARVDELYGLFLDAQMAFVQMQERLASLGAAHVISDESPFHFGTGHPQQPTSQIAHSATLGEVKARMLDGGKNQTLIARYLVVLLFHLWETEYRERIATAARVRTNDVKAAIFGDLRLLRIDILHHGAILRDESARKLEVLNHMANVGSAIDFDRFEIDHVVRTVYAALDELEEHYTGRSPGYAKPRHLPNPP